jgi:hypothetical protein
LQSKFLILPLVPCNLDIHDVMEGLLNDAVQRCNTLEACT